jgi:hypothetical protein
MAISRENLWGTGLTLVGVALAVYVGKLLGTICGIVGIALIIWAQFHKPDVQKQIRIAFGKLMEEGKILELRMSQSQNLEEFNSLGKTMADWVNRTARTFTEFDMDTDAGAFLYSGDSPSDPLAQLAIYRAKLQEIVERRNL